MITPIKKYSFLFSTAILLSSVAIEGNNASGLNKLISSAATRKNMAVGAVISSVLYVMLKTKKTNYNLSMKNFTHDFNMIIESIKEGNMREAGSLAYQFFQDYFIGREFKSLAIGFEEVTENGTVIKVKDTKIKCLPFGVIGLFDAYVLKQLEGITKAHTNTVGIILALANFVAISELQSAKS